MAAKRKASHDEVSPAKRMHQAHMHRDDPIYEEAHSDAEYSAPGTPSAVSGDLHDTPATPFSTTSSRYPSELKTHYCPFEGCDKAYNRPARLQEHIRSHNNERLFECTFEGCDKSFLRTSHLTHHLKSAHSNVRDYICDRPGCGKSFVTGSRLRRHLAAHDGRDKYRCTEYPPCDETFRKHTTLQKHIVTVHLHQKPFKCGHVDADTGHKCQMAFDTAGHLRAHESRVHTEKRYSCTECTQHLQEQSSRVESNGTDHDLSITFPTYALLQEHIRAVHPPECPHCPVVCATSRELRRHLEVAHGDVSIEERKAFLCSEQGCDRSFTKKGNLTVHIRTVHKGEKRFACGETDLSGSKKVPGWDGIGCGKRYGSKLALEEHIRTAHLGYQNAKAERRQRVGLTKDPQSGHHLSTLAAITGHGYAEESGRHIACFYDSCEHRFHRDYDLWVHMTSKHHCSEDEVQGLFMQRALLTDQSGPGGNALGIYGLEFDHDDTSVPHAVTTADHSTVEFPSHLASTEESSTFAEQHHLENDFVMQDMFNLDAGQGVHSILPSHDDMMSVDPVLAYNLMEQ